MDSFPNEEYHLNQNLFFNNVSNGLDFQPMLDSNYNLINSNLINNSNNEIIRVKDEQIRDLKRKIKNYQKAIEEQKQKLIDYDNLRIDYNSINSNYSELEAEYLSLKANYTELLEQLQKKNIIIEDYRKVLEISKKNSRCFNRKKKNFKIKEMKLKLN